MSIDHKYKSRDKMRRRSSYQESDDEDGLKIEVSRRDTPGEKRQRRPSYVEKEDDFKLESQFGKDYSKQKGYMYSKMESGNKKKYCLSDNFDSRMQKIFNLSKFESAGKIDVKDRHSSRKRGNEYVENDDCIEDGEMADYRIERCKLDSRSDGQASVRSDSIPQCLALGQGDNNEEDDERRKKLEKQLQIKNSYLTMQHNKYKKDVHDKTGRDVEADPTEEEVLRQVSLPTSIENFKDPACQWVETNMSVDFSWDRSKLPEEEIIYSPDHKPPTPPKIDLSLIEFCKSFEKECMPYLGKNKNSKMLEIRERTYDSVQDALDDLKDMDSDARVVNYAECVFACSKREYTRIRKEQLEAIRKGDFYKQPRNLRWGINCQGRFNKSAVDRSSSTYRGGADRSAMTYGKRFRSPSTYRYSTDRHASTYRSQRDRSSPAYGRSRDRSSSSYGRSRDRSTSTYGRYRDRSSSTYGRSKDRRSSYYRRGADRSPSRKRSRIQRSRYDSDDDYDRYSNRSNERIKSEYDSYDYDRRRRDSSRYYDNDCTSRRRQRSTSYSRSKSRDRDGRYNSKKKIKSEARSRSRSRLRSRSRSSFTSISSSSVRSCSPPQKYRR